MTLPQVLQFWDLPDTPDDQAVSFDLSPTPEKELITWRMDFPGSLASAEQRLQLSEQQLLVSEKALENIQVRAEALASQIINEDPGDLSFQFIETSSPEGELCNLLNLISPSAGGINFDTLGRSASNWQDANKQLESSLSRLNQVFTQYAVVETSFHGCLIGSTMVSWSGKYVTSWQASSQPTSILLHQRSLRVAMASRRLFMNMFSVSAMSAARISVLLAIPGGALFTLPAIWKFVTRILGEIEKYHNLTQ